MRMWSEIYMAILMPHMNFMWSSIWQSICGYFYGCRLGTMVYEYKIYQDPMCVCECKYPFRFLSIFYKQIPIYSKSSNTAIIKKYYNLI